MGLIEHGGTAADGHGSTYTVECDDDYCGAWRHVSPRELAMGPKLRARDDWKTTDDGRTFCPEHAAEYA